MLKDIIFGIIMSNTIEKEIDWELLLSTAARLNKILPEAVLVGGTAASLYARHRVSFDADFVLVDLREKFDNVLATLESIVGWVEARTIRPVPILGNIDGIETGVRLLIRSKPLETKIIDYKGLKLTVPTEEEILRIKAFLILKRNATRDYVDFVALVDHLEVKLVAKALQSFDSLYPQKSGQSTLQQLHAQLSSAMPFDLKQVDLNNYKNLSKRYSNFEIIRKACADIAVKMFDFLCEFDEHD
jgi:hypothetical protein